MDDNAKLIISEDMFISQKGNKFLFLNPNIPDWLVVNNNSAFILNKCDGKNTINNIVQQASELGGEETEGEARDLLDQAQKHSIITSTKAGNNNSLKKMPVPSKQSLQIVHLKLTDECNLKCKYCYAKSGGKSSILSFEELTQLSLDVNSISHFVEFVLSGGEPLLHPHCLDFAELVKSKGNEAHLLSNGTLINEKNAGRIAECCDLIKISLDGATEKTHSLTRGANNYSKVTTAIDLLNKHDANVLIAMTVTRRNLHEIPKLVERYGSQLTFQPFFHAGRGSSRTDLALTGKEYYNALYSTPGVNPMGAIEKVLSRARTRGIFKCAIGDSEISISHNGDVFPCQMLDDPLFLAGNVHETPLQDIYNKSKVLKEVRQLNVNNIKGCESCPVKLICGGACRARTFHENGEIIISGDFCEYERLAYINGIFDSVSID
jgi:radical SAM protein with 4Fe4S-binding SPASM domain